VDLKTLATRYGITPASLKARVSFLDLELPPSSEELAMLDALNAHLEDGKPISTFQYIPEASVEIVRADSGSLKQIAASSETIPPIEFEALERVYGFLQKAADHGWHLPTSVIRGITGSTPRGASWKRFGFEFKPASKHGVEKAWSVEKASFDY
jgi:hypothetical protein